MIFKSVRSCFSKKKTHIIRCAFSFWRYRPDLNWRITVLQTGALPLGYGTIWKSGTRGYVPDLWSGRRGSNSLPPPWQGGALPDELRPHIMVPTVGIEYISIPGLALKNGASGRNRTNDTRIFSPLLYLLSYRGILWRAVRSPQIFYGDPERTRTVDLQRDRLAC